MYVPFYGFSEEPFRDTPDPRFFFSIPGRQGALSCLLQGVEERSGWILLSGGPGSGKTILIRHLWQSLKNRSDLKTAFIFQTRISFEDLLKAILSALRLPPASAAGVPIAEHFSRSLSQILSPEDTLVIFLDEAQDFSVEVLKKIQNFFGREFPRPDQIQVVFSGQPPLEEKLKSQALHHLQQRIKFRCPIAPFTAQESRRYIDHRLHLVGGNSRLFTPEALSLIVRYGEGVPRTLNIICDNALRLGHQNSESKISAAVVRKALQEMYVQTGWRGVFRRAAEKKPVSRKIFYSLTAIIGFTLLVFFVMEHSQRDKGNVNAKGGETAEKFKQEDPVPFIKGDEEKPPQEKLSAPIPQENITIPEPAAEAALPAAVSLMDPKIEGRVKKIITVKQGGALSSLCLEHYGFTNITLLDHVLALNPEIANPNIIRVHQKIRLPDLKEENLIQEKPGGKVQAFLGTFAHPDSALFFRQEPLLKGKQIEITPREIQTGETWHRFSAGMFVSREEALKLVRALKKKGILPFFGGSPQKTGKPV